MAFKDNVSTRKRYRPKNTFSALHCFLVLCFQGVSWYRHHNYLHLYSFVLELGRRFVKSILRPWLTP